MAHICLMSPAQRGGFNVSDPGDNSCYNPVGPCGTVPSSAPTVTLTGGQWSPVFMQQNLNHYSQGHAGTMRLAMAFVPNPTQADFYTFLVIPDFNAHLQAKQTNLSTAIKIPEVNVPHAVLQVTYAPHQQGEVPFYACADVAIVQAPAMPATNKLYTLMSDGASAPEESRSFLVGAYNTAGDFTGIQSAPAGAEYTEGLLTVSTDGSQLFALARYPVDEANDDSAATFIVAGTPGGTPTAPVNITVPRGDAYPDHWQALVPVHGAADPFDLALVGVTVDAVSGNYTMQARYVNGSTGAAGPVRAFCPPGQRFVNFQWASKVVGSKLYILAGDENSLTQLYAAVFTVDLEAGSCTMAQLDVSAFTFSALHVDPDTGRLYAVSPGLYGESAYSLVEVDASTGAVQAVGGAGSLGSFAWEYRGAVGGDSISAGGTLLHVFTRIEDGQRVLAQVSVASGKVIGTPAAMFTGTNNENSFTTPVYSAAAAAAETRLTVDEQVALVKKAKAAVRRHGHRAL